jgi:hypothetical protein
MNEARMKILEMLSKGKITVEEASALLEKVIVREKEPEAEAASGDSSEASPGKRGLPRYLRVMVDSNDGDKVNVRVPLSLIRTGLKLGSLMPAEAASAVQERGIDLSVLKDMDGEELVEALRELTVDVDSADGDKVRVFTE